MAFYFGSEDGSARTASDASDVGGSGKSDYQYFKQRLHEEVLRSQRRQHAFTLLRIAIENSTRNPEELIAVIISAIREYDLVCHMQMGDYAIVLPETGEKYAEKIAGRIKQLIAERMNERALAELHDPRIGIACFPYDGTNAEDLLISAEQDLFHQRP
jgi:hypothetical protein